MEFKKIQVTKKSTLNLVYEDGAGNLITFCGANIVHKDLRQAMNGLVPHIALITEQREADGRTLKQVESDRITDGNSRSVFRILGVDTINLSEGENAVSIKGYRILQSNGVINIETHQMTLGDKDAYKYTNELAVAIDAVKYEAKAYLNEEKWGIKEGTLDFGEDDPFKGVKADDVPDAGAVSEEKPKRGRKTKKEQVA